MTLPPECDFCDQVLDDDESLEPVYVGAPPAPQPVVARGSAPKLRRTVGYGTGEDVEVLGKPADEVQALLAAIDAHDGMALETYQAVHEATALTPHGGPGEWRYDRDDETVSAALCVEPRGYDREPDLWVCAYCADTFRDA